MQSKRVCKAKMKTEPNVFFNSHCLSINKSSLVVVRDVDAVLVCIVVYVAVACYCWFLTYLAAEGTKKSAKNYWQTNGGEIGYSRETAWLGSIALLTHIVPE